MTQPDQIEALTARLRADLDRIHADILAELEALALEWPTLARAARRRRLTVLEAHIVALADQADAIAARTILGVMQSAYEVGAWSTALTAATSPVFAGLDVDAVTHLARDTMGDLLHATRGVRQDTKQLIRELTRDQVRAKLYTGGTAIQAGKDLAKTLLGRGVAAVTYANGARVPLPVYAAMVVRTKTAEAYQEGGLNQGERLGIAWWQVFDGPDCGWTSHDDPQTADGMIIPLEQARKHPTSHPNCRRSTSPRPDLVTADDVRRARPVDQPVSVQQAAVAAQQRTHRAVAASSTPTRRTAGLDLQAGTLPPTAAGARHAAILRRHSA